MQQQQLRQQHAQACTDAQQDSAGSDPGERSTHSSVQHADDGPAPITAAAPEPHDTSAAATIADPTDAGHAQGDTAHAGVAAAASLRTPAPPSGGGLFATAKGKVIRISEAQRRKGEALLAWMEAAGAADPPSPPQQPQKPNTFRAPKPFNRPRPRPVCRMAPVRPCAACCMIPGRYSTTQR